MDAWRIFDTCIVGIGIMASTGAKIPAVNAIRAIRVLRAVRLLKKSKSLKPIVEALFSSIGPVLNSMVLLVGTSQNASGQPATYLTFSVFPDLFNTNLTPEDFCRGSSLVSMQAWPLEVLLVGYYLVTIRGYAGRPPICYVDPWPPARKCRTSETKKMAKTRKKTMVLLRRKVLDHVCSSSDRLPTEQL